MSKDVKGLCHAMDRHHHTRWTFYKIIFLGVLRERERDRERVLCNGNIYPCFNSFFNLFFGEKKKRIEQDIEI